MSYTQSDLDALNAAIASGEKQVALGAQQVTYRSIAELVEARNLVRADLIEQAAVSASSQKSRITKLYSSGRGY